VPIQLINAYAGGAVVLTRAKFTTPKLRAINNVNLRPLDVAAVPSTRPPLVEFFHHPLSLNPIDENQVLASTSALAATPLLIAAWYGDGNFNVPAGDMFSIHASQSITTVANAWATGPITLCSAGWSSRTKYGGQVSCRAQPALSSTRVTRAGVRWVCSANSRRSLCRNWIRSIRRVGRKPSILSWTS
jgi:hypothetical protein